MVVRTNDPMAFSVKSQKSLEFHFRDKWSGQLVLTLRPWTINLPRFVFSYARSMRGLRNRLTKFRIKFYVITSYIFRDVTRFLTTMLPTVECFVQNDIYNAYYTS